MKHRKPLTYPKAFRFKVRLAFILRHILEDDLCQSVDGKTAGERFYKDYKDYLTFMYLTDTLREDLKLYEKEL